MAEKLTCDQCGQPMMDGLCVNEQCSLTTGESMMPFGSLVPEDVSLDLSQVIDYTGTIGVAPDDYGADFAQDSLVADEDDSAQTRMIDDNFYKQIQAFFPAHSDSKSAGGDSSTSGSAGREPNPDMSRSVSLHAEPSNFSIEEFVPPVRDIQFPSDTSSLEQIRDMDDAELEGDEYHIIEKLGEGGYGTVFEAEQLALNRPVAIKVLKPKRRKSSTRSKGSSRSGTGTGTGELQRRRDQFLHEAKITARLQHPNIVPLYDFGINSTGQLFYSMKKVQRRPWSDVLHKPARLLNIADSDVDELAERQAISRNIEIFSRVCDGVAYSHSMKVVHRDLKPDNIMIGDYGEVLLIDFGMALDFSTTSREFSAGGTLVYMAPEMAEHFAKQKEIQVAAQKTAKRMGIDKGSIFLDQSNLVGVGKLAERLVQESVDKGVVDLARTLIGLASEEKKLAASISYASDIYLLGAILYQVAVGHPPHYFPLSACKKGAKEKFQKELWLASRNGFQQYAKITDPLRLSLRAIAVQAMATDPKDRFQTVEELQEAIRGFQLQVQSMELAETGKEELTKSEGREDYRHLLPALEAFRGASELWPDSQEATSLQQDTACEYANRANDRKDFDAGLSILDEYVLESQQQESAVVEVRDKLNRGKQVRTRNRRLAIAGWIATVVIPFIAIGLAIPVLNQARTAEAKLAELQPELEKADKRIQTAKDSEAAALAKAKDAADKEVKANKAAALAGAKAIKASKLAEDKTKEAEKAGILADTKTKEAEAATELAKKSAMDAAKAEEDAKAAQTQAQLAVDAAEDAKQLADKFQFDADFGEYNANVLTIPLDLRTSKLEQAKAKLNKLNSSDDTKPQFKNGWLVKHFEKRLNSAKSVQVSNNGQILKLVARPGSDDGQSLAIKQSLAIGINDGSPAVWSVNSEGKVDQLEVELPATGKIAGASISSDGEWLGLAMDSVTAEVGANAILVNLDDGSQIGLPKESLEKLAGCRYLEFSDQDNDRLVVVEEVKGFNDLKQRVHVVEYKLQGSTLTEVSRTPLDATERNEGRVKYLANVQWIDGRPVTAVAYSSLLDKKMEKGAYVERLQVVKGKKALDAIEAERFPSALLVGQNGKLFCGHLDGMVEYFDCDNLQAGSTPLPNQNENEIAVLIQADDGRLFSGSENGKIVIWDAGLDFQKEIDGQLGQLSSLAVAGVDQKDGLKLLSGDLSGSVNFWKPETGYNEAVLNKKNSVTVNCGAIDQGLNAGEIPATAFGTAAGEVFYFDSTAMVARGGGEQVGEDSGGLQLGATFGFRSPFESFDTAFNDFDSMGIVGDSFVVLKDNGTLFTALIDESQGQTKLPSSNVNSVRYRDADQVKRDFVPVLGSVHDQDLFYTNDPTDETQLLLWTRAGKSFAAEPVGPVSSGDGEIKRIAMSYDGRWLAVVRLADRASGEYFAEIFGVAASSGQLSLATTTDTYRVGDPAYVGFSADSQTLMLDSHKLGADRETWVEQWQLTGSVWTLQEPRTKIADRKVDVIDWEDESQSNQVVTRLNRNFYLKQLAADIKPSSQQMFEVSANSGRLRNVQSAKVKDQFYVLAAKRLARHQGVKLTKEVSQIGSSVIENARDMRVFGDRVVILDQTGFHLFDEDLNYVAMLASRKPSVTEVALSNGRLAIQYDNQLCRIWDVSGDEPRGVGKANRVSNVQLSPDGKWAACRTGKEVKVFDVRESFKDPQLTLPLVDGVFQWSGKTESTLILANSKDDGTEWLEVDPATGNQIFRQDLPKELTGVTDFALAPLTESFVAIQQKSDDGESLSVWATGVVPVPMNKDDHEFDATAIKNIESISFSEIAQDKVEAIGTRMVILGSADAESKAVPRIYLLAKQELKTDDQQAGDQSVYQYRVVEIEGALQSSSNDALELSDLEFAGDGKSLLQVHTKGTLTLISQ